MLTLLYAPHSYVINPCNCLVEVANKWLYCGWDWCLDVLYKIHPFSFSNISRFDVCCDFVLTPQRKAIIKQLANNSAYIANKSEGSMFYEYDNVAHGRIQRFPKCISWGAKNSSIKWKVYNKSKEICQFADDGSLLSCEKPYILAEWEEHGFDIHNVWRLEVSITQAHKFEWLGDALDIHKIRNYFYFEDLFISLYNTRFIIRENQGHKDKTNDRRLHLLSFPALRDRLARKEPSTKREAVEFISVVNALMKQRSQPECQINETIYNGLTRTIIEVVHSASLEHYFNRVYGYPIEEIDRLKLNNISAPSIKKISIMPKSQKMASRQYKLRAKRFTDKEHLFFNNNRKKFYLLSSEDLENPYSNSGIY